MAVNITDRSAVEALIREQIVSTIFQDAPKQSAFMGMARKLPNMTSKQTRIQRSGLPSDRILGGWRHRDEADFYAGMG